MSLRIQEKLCPDRAGSLTIHEPILLFMFFFFLEWSGKFPTGASKAPQIEEIPLGRDKWYSYCLMTLFIVSHIGSTHAFKESLPTD